ncbi:MAG: DUF885 domain-containing protein [Wenzhouxiangellaceae bacterium]
MYRQLFLPAGLALLVIATACQPDGSSESSSASTTAATAATASNQALSADQQFQQWLESYFAGTLAFNPYEATAMGLSRYNDKLPNFFSAEFRDRQRAFANDWLQRIKTLDREQLSASNRISYDVFVYQQQQTLTDLGFPDHWLPLNQMFSFPVTFAQMGSGRSFHPFNSVENYDDWLTRLTLAPGLLDQIIANLQQGIAEGVVLPRVITEKVLPQIEQIAVTRAEDSLFWQPLNDFPEDITADQRQRLTQAFRQQLDEQLLPAYRRLHDYLATEYLPRSRDTIGYGALPAGADWYQQRIASQTTTQLSAMEIHQYGQREVQRILDEMQQVKTQVGFGGDLQAFFEYLRTDDQFYYSDAEALLQGYRDLQQRIDERLPRLFDLIPDGNYVVAAVDPLQAPSASAAFYLTGSGDGSRPSTFYINTHDLRAQPKYRMETLSLHEASPGHHFQISLQLDIDDLPAFRRYGRFTAFMEGWALYAESLGPELGLFEDPYAYFGRLSDEQLRAMRLVVDTGIHALGWSRQQAIQYMLDHSPMAESSVIAQVDRYIALPGQALAYKLGERVIRGLRSEAEQALGEAFDIRAFHRFILRGGAMPMELLQQRVRAWIAQQSPTSPDQ